MKAKAEVEETAVVAAPENDPTGGSLATAEDYSLCSSGDFDAEDFQIPYLAIVHNTGKLKKQFPVGAWVLNKSVVIAEETKPFPATCIYIKKYYEELFQTFDQNNMSRSFNSEDEAKSAGLKRHSKGTTKDGCYATSYIVDWLIECPAEEAMFDYNGKPLVRCRMYMRSTAAAVPRQVITAGIVPAIGKVWYKLALELHTVRVEGQTNDWPEPRVTRKGLADPAFVDWIKKNIVTG